MDDKETKTEEATPKRLRDARKKGQVAKSGDVTAASSFLIFTILASVLGNFMLTNSIAYLRNSLSRDFGVVLNTTNTGPMLISSMIRFGFLLLPFALIAIAIGIIGNLIQTGFLFTLEPLKPNFKKLNPIEGFKNIFSKKAAFSLVKNILKLTLVFYMTYKNLSSSLVQILNSGDIGSEKLFYFMLKLIKDLSLNIAIIMLGLAIVDYIFQRRDYKKDLKMSKQEIKDEFKEMEGSPQIKSARQQKQRQLAMSRMMSSVKTSTVVITNPTHLAIVLRYDNNKDKAPVVTAKGADYIAQKIREVAKENNIPIMENKELARAMYKKVDIGDVVPVELYKAVAEILALVYQMKEKNKHKI